jgi:hypothetical protein
MLVILLGDGEGRTAVDDRLHRGSRAGYVMSSPRFAP